MQSSKQWYILDEYLRFDKKRSATVKQDGCPEIKLIWLSKSNQSLGGDDYFFALLTSFPSIYPAPPQIAIRANNAS